MSTNAEYLKHVVQEVMSAFQTGAGLFDGKPEPMTYELAVRRIWQEIDRVFSGDTATSYQHGYVTMRVQSTRPLVEMLGVLYGLGRWTVWGTTRHFESATTVLHVAGSFNDGGDYADLFGRLSAEQMEVTDFTAGLSQSVS